MMETPSSVLECARDRRARRRPENRLACLVMGTNDLLKELRARALHNRIAVVPWLAMTIVAARAYGLDVLDGVYNDFRDEAGFREECEHGRTLGMDGKTLIHPSQVVPCNEVFSPTEEEVAWSRKIIAAFEDPANARKGVIRWRARWSSGCTASWRGARWPSPTPSRPCAAPRRSGSSRPARQEGRQKECRQGAAISD